MGFFSRMIIYTLHNNIFSIGEEFLGKNATIWQLFSLLHSKITLWKPTQAADCALVVDAVQRVVGHGEQRK